MSATVPEPEGPPRPRRAGRARMAARERRAQLLDVGRTLFAERGYEATSVEEIAVRAEVSKPVVYEHFGGKEGLYAVIVDREVERLTQLLLSSLSGPGHPRIVLYRTALALLDYIEENTDAFRILVRDSPVAQATGTFSSLLGDVAAAVEHLIADQYEARGLDPETAPMYAQMLVGMVALTGQWWLEARSPEKTVVAAHLVNLAWNGLRGLREHPELDPSVVNLTRRREAERRSAAQHGRSEDPPTSNPVGEGDPSD